MNEILLHPPYESESHGKEAGRTCFTCSCSMLLRFEKPGSLDTVNGQLPSDKYLTNLEAAGGDTTDQQAQVATLHRYGLKTARFIQNGNWDIVDKQLESGHPVAMGILHHSYYKHPTGGGHWILCIGRSADGASYHFHDPNGALDEVNGGYPNPGNNGANRIYSKEHISPRWMVGGPNNGWAVLAS